jgi:hypothetical protein
LGWGSTLSPHGVVKIALSGVLRGAGLVLRGPRASLVRNIGRSCLAQVLREFV